MDNSERTPFVNDEAVYNRTIKAIPVPEKEIGIDTKEQIFQNLINASSASVINVGELEAFTTASRSRDQVYRIIEVMAEDSKLSAVLETYAEDATEYNDKGQIVWVDSSNPDIAAFVNFLLKTLCVDKNIYKWTYNLCKYGDLYLRLYRKSEYTDLLFGNPKTIETENKKLEEELDSAMNYSGDIDGNSSSHQSLNESVKIKAYAKSDKYVHYVEMVDNPAEVFELTRFGKTAGYVQAQLPVVTTKQNDLQTQGFYKYKFRQADVNLFAATEFVHVCLEDNTSRVPEEVDIFVDNSTNSMYNGQSSTMSYKVKRGQSLLYSAYKVWRELTLLESSVLLNRTTQSSLVRIIGIEVGEMPKESVGPHVQGVKRLIEQNMAIDVGNGMSEFTNPAPIINNVYTPTRNGVGAISAQTLGGDYDPKSLIDLEYYLNNLYGTLRVPKQYFNQTDDATGFNGGTSLAQISSRYAKMIKRIQSKMTQGITDIINLMLLDADLGNYVNQFTIHMLPPTTLEEKERRENLSTRIQLTRDVMDLLGDGDPETKMKALKILIDPVLQNQDFSELLESEIEAMKKEDDEKNPNEASIEDSEEFETGGDTFDANEPLNLDSDVTTVNDGEEEPISASEEPGEELPSATDMGVDITDTETIENS